MNLQQFQTTMQGIQAPAGLEDRLLAACRTKGRSRKRTVGRWIPAAAGALALLLAVLAPVLNDFPFAPAVSLYASASDVTQEVDLAANGILDCSARTLFFAFDNRDIERVELYNSAGRLRCFFHVENAQSGAWDTYTISIPYEMYATSVQDPENPTHEELARLLEAAQDSCDRLDGITDEIERFETLYGTQDIDFLPLIVGAEIFSKTTSSFVAVSLQNPDSVLREPVEDAQNLTVEPGEEIEWILETDDISADFADTIETTVYFKNGRTLSGRIWIQGTADGRLQAGFENDG